MIRLQYQIPTCLQRLYRGVVWRHPQAPSREGDVGVVYLTFDDGPVPEVTPAILDVLKEAGVQATFFMVGENAERYPELVARVCAEGHTIGNHTYHHVKGWSVSTEEYIEEVERTRSVLTSLTSSTSLTSLTSSTSLTSMFYRPPYGKMTFRQHRALRRMGYTIVLWDVLTHDWDPHYSPERMLAIIKRYTRTGSIINFHDSLKSADRTPETVRRAIEWLRESGYELAPLPGSVLY